MRVKIERTIGNFVIFVAILAVMVPGALAGAGGSVVWTGNGDRTLAEPNCEDSAPNEMLWIFTLGGKSNVTASNLTIQGYPVVAGVESGNTYKFTTQYISATELITLKNNGGVEVTYDGTLGNGNSVLTISHGCPEIPIPEFPTIALPVAAILGLMFIFGRKRDL